MIARNPDRTSPIGFRAIENSIIVALPDLSGNGCAMWKASLNLAIALSAYAGAAAAQPYPSVPVTLIVPFGAGGPVDTLARSLSEAMRMSLGQPVIIENVTGASGTHRRRPRRARGARRLHGEHRQLALAHRQWRDLLAALRCAEGLRAGRAPAQQSLRHRRAQRFAGQRPQGVDRLAQGQPGQGNRRAPPGPAPASTSAASTFRTSPARAFSSCPIAPAPPRSCATSWPATSISPSTRPSPRFPMCATAR